MKNNSPYLACQIYKGAWVFEETYIDKTNENIEQWTLNDEPWTIEQANKHDDIRKESKPEKHLRENLNHKCKWETHLQAPKFYRQQKNLEASFIFIMGPTLNSQSILYLFRNGAIW